MRKVIIRILSVTGVLFTPLLADFYPATTETSVAAVSGKGVTLSKPLPAKGMSGIVVHRYNDELKAISTFIRYDGGSSAALVSFEPTQHANLPAVSPQVSTGDRVVGGYLYQNILLLAPNADTYNKITASASKNWIHPDLFALFLAQEGDTYPTRENLAKFASIHQVGLVYIVKQGSAVLYDPVSRAYVSKKSLDSLPGTGQVPFYSRVGNIDSGWFSGEAKGNYYQIMGAL